MQKEINGAIFYDEFAEIAESIPAWEWDLHDYTEEQSDQLYHLMEQQGVTKAELARRLGVSKAFITKVLRGDANMNSKTFIRLVNALEGQALIKIVPKAAAGASRVQWFGLVKTANEQKRPVAPLKKLVPLCPEVASQPKPIEDRVLAVSETYQLAV